MRYGLPGKGNIADQQTAENLLDDFFAIVLCNLYSILQFAEQFLAEINL